MIAKELEVRTKEHKMLMCMAKCMETGESVLEVKNGKRTDWISLEQFLEEISHLVDVKRREMNNSYT